MTDNSIDQVSTLQRQASNLPYGPTQVALLEEAVRLADCLNDLDLAFEVRSGLMHAAAFGGRPDLLLVAFSWCIAQHDRNPNRFRRDDLLWKYKWVIGNAHCFPEISRSRLEELLADMERRFRQAGSTLHAVAMMRRKLAVHFGDWPQARAAHAEFRRRRRDYLSDCPACVAFSNCDYYIRLGQSKRALQAAQPVLQSRLACAEEPHNTLSAVLLPLFRLGSLEEAKSYQRQGYRLIGQASQFVRQHAEQIRFLTLIGELSQAKRLIERHLPSALATVLLNEQFGFFLAAHLWTDRMQERGIRKLKIRLPKGPPPPNADGNSETSALTAWFSEQARDIARRFDARNGSNEFQRQIDQLPKLLSLAVDRD